VSSPAPASDNSNMGLQDFGVRPPRSTARRHSGELDFNTSVPSGQESYSPYRRSAGTVYPPRHSPGDAAVASPRVQRSASQPDIPTLQNRGR
jgi:hypothetical protein